MKTYSTILNKDFDFSVNNLDLFINDDLSKETTFLLSNVRVKEYTEIGQKQALRQIVSDYEMLLNIKDGDYFGYGNIMTPEIRNNQNTVIEEIKSILSYKGDFISLKNKTGNSNNKSN